jgi:Tol biopolymer transport system component
VRVGFVGLPPINNDHVLDADRGRIYLSANDGHIYMAPMDGGRAERVTWDDTRFHFLHGVNPNGTELAFVELSRDDFSVPGRLALLSISDGSTRYPAVGTTPLDGPEYSPDGEWIYLNTEEFGVVPGHAQIARIPSVGGVLQQLVDSPTVDWFPHLSPDGARATYISFPPGTVGHPADLEVEIHVVQTDHWQHSILRIPFRGGQGSMNVNSWAPDSARFAYVTYPESKL